jgi:hypothetical protein
MTYWDSFKTGDLCITATAGIFPVFARIITNSDYNHACVAIRIDVTKLPRIQIVHTGGTLLFIEGLHMLSSTKFLKVNDMSNTKILQLSLNDKYYTNDFVNNIYNLIYNDMDTIKLNNKIITIQKPEVYEDINNISKKYLIKYFVGICSEYSANFYNVTLHKHIEFESSKFLFVPGDFLKSSNNPYYNLFHKTTVIYETQDFNYSVCVLILILVIIILMILYINFIIKLIKYNIFVIFKNVLK